MMGEWPTIATILVRAPTQSHRRHRPDFWQAVNFFLLAMPAWQVIH